MNADDLLRQRLSNQRLASPQPTDPRDVVAWLGAVQAQDYVGAKWALGQRLAGSTDSALDRAFDEGAILRTHALRPTWHFVAPADIRWLLELTGPRVRALLGHYDRRLGVDADLIRRSSAAIARALEGGRYLARAELGAPLRAAGIAAKGQTLGHLVMHAELDGLICSGPRRGKQFTYALLEERAPSASRRSRDEALAELVRRYFVSHGPATLRDFAWWSGLTVGDARRGIAMLGPRLSSQRVGQLEYWLAPTAAPPMPRTAYLLPNYDEYTIAYRDRDLFFDATRAAALARPANVPFDHAVVLGGRVIGVWRRTFGKSELTVETRLFAELDDGGRAELQRAAERYGRFLGRPVVLDGRPI